MKKNLFYLIFLFAIAFLFSFSFPILENWAKEVKREMKMKIHKNNFKKSDLIAFSESDLVGAKWKDTREFYLNGKLYDVVSIEQKNQKKIYHCLSDFKETAISNTHQFLVSIFKSENFQKNISVPKITPSNFQNIFIENQSGNQLVIFPANKIHKGKFHYSNNYFSFGEFSFLDPPEKLLFT